MRGKKVTADQVEDIIAYAISEAKPSVKVKRTATETVVTVGRKKFLVLVAEMPSKRK